MVRYFVGRFYSLSGSGQIVVYVCGTGKTAKDCRQDARRQLRTVRKSFAYRLSETKGLQTHHPNLKEVLSHAV